MSARLREARSRLAIWSAWLAALSLPVLIIAAIGHRAGLIDATSTYGVIALGFSLAALGVLAALAAFVAIWRDGSKGVGAAFRGITIGLAVLVMPALGAWQVVTEPRLTDISTDLSDPPQFALAIIDREPTDANIVDPGPVEAALQKEAYPDIAPRHYPVSTARVFLEAKAIVDRRGWRLLSSVEPSDTNASGTIEAVALTLVFAFRQDVVIRVVPDGDGSRVDMRSAARNTVHDLGSNADRVRQFFVDLDAALAGITSN